MKRRAILGLSAAAAGRGILQAATIPVIDTHVHVFDTGRPGDVPWPEKKDAILYRPALPERYRQVASPQGIKGCIAIEASPLLEDNQWVLDTISRDPLFVGSVGYLRPGKPGFARDLERFHRNPLFLGIRCGNVWGWNPAEFSSAEFVRDLKTLADTGLAMDSADPDPALLSAIVRLTDRVPNLRVVIDHLPQFTPPTEARALRAYQSDLRELGKRPQVYAKLSEIPRRVGGKVPRDLNFYRPRLDELWGIFGEDRLVYGSDWPNSELWGPYSLALKLVREYVSEKGRAAEEKVFWKNSVAAYRWVKRDPGQPH